MQFNGDDNHSIIRNDTGVQIFDLIICGELIGGTYPHKDVEEVMNVKRVQKGEKIGCSSNSTP